MVSNKAGDMKTPLPIYKEGTQFQVIHKKIKQLLVREEKLILLFLKIKAN